MWETLHNNADWNYFKTLILPVIFEDSNSTSGRILCKFGGQFHVCSHDGIPALDLWDLVIEVLHCSSNQPKKSKDNVQGNLLHDTQSRKHTNNQVKTPIRYNDLELCNVNYVSSDVKSSQFGAMLYFFEDNEAVIKMIIKGRSPTMRHVFRTHRVGLDWLFDRIVLDQKIQTHTLTPNTKSQTY